MTKLNADARAAIREAGFTAAQWAAMWGYRGEWGGDACGCFDDRCIGHHHYGANDCGCLETMLSDATAWRAAIRELNRVALAHAPYGLYRWVDVSTPESLVTVSTSAGSAARPQESVVRIEARDGWTATVGQDEHGRMEIRLVKAAAPEAQRAAEEATGEKH